MATRQIFFFLFLAFYRVICLAEVPEARCKISEKIMDYSTLGDCYDQGVYYSKDKEKAKINYLYGAMQSTRQGEYGKLQAARTLLFKSKSEIENAMGLYILKGFSDSSDAAIVEKPAYEGDYTYRGAARYYLAIYFALQDDYKRASTYLDLAIQDNYFWAYYASLYVRGEMKAQEVENLFAQAEQVRKKYFPWYPSGYSCWLQWQRDYRKTDELTFPVNAKKVDSLLEQYGACENAE